MMSQIVMWLKRRAENFAALLLACMFATFLIQITFRYFLNLPLGWSVEFVTIAWLWGILFGYAFVATDEDIIRLDIVYGAMPVPVKRIMDGITGLTAGAIFAWSLPQVYDYVTFMEIERTAFIRIRFDYVFSIYLAFAVAVIARSLRSVWRAITGRGYNVSHSRSEAGGIQER
jgi:C4-dicarboxylate transporter, DctQ subunit